MNLEFIYLIATSLFDSRGWAGIRKGKGLRGTAVTAFRSFRKSGIKRSQIRGVVLLVLQRPTSSGKCCWRKMASFPLRVGNSLSRLPRETIFETSSSACKARIILSYKSQVLTKARYRGYLDTGFLFSRGSRCYR